MDEQRLDALLDELVEQRCACSVNITTSKYRQAGTPLALNRKIPQKGGAPPLKEPNFAD